MQESIKDQLRNRFITEASVPGITMTKKVQGEEGKVNKAAQAEIGKKFGEYDKATGKKAKDAIAPPKRELSKKEVGIHNTVENDGGMEDLQFDGETNPMFTERQVMAIEGDSKMGNETKTGKWNPKTGEGNGNTEPVWGASNKDFGKNLIKQTKQTKELKDKTPAIRQFGNDIESAEGKTIGSTKKIAVESIENKTTIKEERMKRLKFKTPFNGMEKALTLIPEGYRVDNKEFEMTDGNETYRIRWEGSLTEGNAIVLKGENKTLVNEDMAKIKHLFNYKSGDTLGIVKGQARIDENKEFSNVWSKTKTLKLKDDVANALKGYGLSESDLSLTQDVLAIKLIESKQIDNKEAAAKEALWLIKNK